MKKNIVASVQHISKTYKLYDKPIDRVKEALNPFGKKYHRDFFAISDVSLELKRGEALGIIGRNGNGKSTLLKMIAGVLTPSCGRITTRGKISAILELTSSLKPELSGMENIRLNLQINGFSDKEINHKIVEIEEFAEIGEFIYQPVKSYSSGMKSRLGFGIATSVEPDILILDEVLAVGDFVFQQKCLAKINAMRDDMSIIFVSHSMNSVRLFCDRVAVLEKGQIVFNGQPDEAIRFYMEKDTSNATNIKQSDVVRPFYGDLFHNTDKICDVLHRWNKDSYALEDEMILKFSFRLNYTPRNLIIGIPIWTKSGEFITSLNSDYYQMVLFHGKQNISGMIKLKCNFNPNDYFSIIAIVDGSEYLYRQQNDDFTVKPQERIFGFVTLSHEWILNK